MNRRMLPSSRTSAGGSTIFDGPITRRFLWSRLLVLVLVCALLFAIFFLILPEALGAFWLLSEGFFAVLLAAIVKRVLDIHLVETFPDGLRVYYIHRAKELAIWHELNVAGYPETTYVPHPSLARIDKKMREMDTDELLRTNLLIKGEPGSGKSRAIVQLVSIIRGRLKSRSFMSRYTSWIPSWRHTKLLVLKRSYLAQQWILPYFNEPTVVIIDDMQDLSSTELDNSKKLLADLPMQTRGRVIICASRLFPPHVIPPLPNLTEVNCSEWSPEDYAKFMLLVARQAAVGSRKESAINVTDDVMLKLVKSAVRNRQPPLYIVLLFNHIRHDLQLDELTDDSLNIIPPVMRQVFDNGWKLLSKEQHCLLRAIKLLKELRRGTDETPDCWSL